MNKSEMERELESYLSYETEPGTHTYHKCKCGRRCSRGGRCSLCLREELERIRESGPREEGG